MTGGTGAPSVTQSVVRSLVGFGTAASVLSLALTVDNLRRIRTPRPAPAPAPAPAPESVAVLLPVRNEVHQVEACVRALARAASYWPGPSRVLVLDDDSTDGTSEVLRSLADEGLIEVLVGTAVPSGWLGKSWACQQLADAADQPPGVNDTAELPAPSVLVFVDADVILELVAISATVDLLRSAGLDLVCPYPRQQTDDLAERLVQPLLQWSWMSTLPLGLAESSPRPSLAAANGQLLAIDAAAYRRCGGHRAVRTEILEDLALVRAVKVGGGTGIVADGTALASCRMYQGAGELRAGYAKSLWAAFGSPLGAVGVSALLLVVHVLPALGALRGSLLGLTGYAASVASRVLVARRTGGRPGDALAHPVSILAFVALVADSLRGHRTGSLTWKDRTLEAPR